jgi:hypothetical protein
MKTNFEKVKDYLLELNLEITHEDPEDEVFVVKDEESGIMNLVLGIADSILIMEQFILEVGENANTDVYKKLLQKNRDIIHGALVVDESGKKVIFRNTLQIETLDLNEIESAVNSLGMLFTEYSDELIQFSK